MMIEEIHLISFKGFQNFKLKCSPFTALVGLNSSGKTSILQSIQLVHDLYRYALGGYDNPDIQRPDFTKVHWSADHRFKNSGVIERQNSGDPDALWLNKRTSTPCEINLKLSDGFEIHLKVIGKENYTLDILRDGSSIKEKIAEASHQRLMERFFFLFPTFVPPTASLPPQESFINYTELRKKLDKGLISECWRSYLYWLCNDGDKGNANRVAEIVQNYLPGTRIKLPQLTHENPPKVLVEFEESDTNFDISVSGGGLRTISSLAVILNFSNSRCLLLDEPDAHLHSTLQHQVAQMLLDHAIENNVQVFVTSHAPDFIAGIPVEHLMWIDRTKSEAHPCYEVSRFLVDLGAVSKADAIRNYGASKVLFIEGHADKMIFSRLSDRLCQENHDLVNLFTDKQVIIAELPGGKGDSKHLNSLRRLLLETFRIEVKIASITDNDYDLTSTQDTNTDTDDKRGVLSLSLKRKEVENYLIDSEAITKLIKNLIDSRKPSKHRSTSYPSIDEVQSEIDLILDSAEIRNTVKYQVAPKYRATLSRTLDESTKEQKTEEWFASKWGDKNWRERNCPGKTVLAHIRNWCQKKYGLTLTIDKLVAHIEHCPEDLEEALMKLQRYFYG